MKQERKIYDAAFKVKAVELSNERSNLSELARELGIKVSLLYKWRKDYQEYGEGSFPGKGNLKLTPEQERIHELEKKLKDAEMERDILKKAISIFSKSGR
ncbi:transposase [Flavobacterium commune]|uniref:Transposase n=1 Tax=Flavobacterium commune TaxID=1306519 RepID=A0A1D9PE09_9FLAO|nr:transposase [Flavobacterium commune]APA00600.1 transposase [Flavobacterium commune]APA00804.1 transposase [Flavobacterium commune]